jgi:hypothetical protein
MSTPEAGTPQGSSPPQQAASVRAQILATEHWSLLATRSMTWSEVMSRIVIHLTVLSASLVVLALVAQVNGFGLAFRVLAISLAAGPWYSACSPGSGSTTPALTTQPY